MEPNQRIDQRQAQSGSAVALRIAMMLLLEGLHQARQIGGSNADTGILDRELDFAAGSMGPKITAACRFVERTGGETAIGSLAELAAVAAGRAGTRVRERVAAGREAGERSAAWT